jgi:site-specific DNA-methyltransferase (adenine-specific)
MISKPRGERNQTLTLSPGEIPALEERVVRVDAIQVPLSPGQMRDRIFCGNMAELLPLLPDRFADLIFLDPPYNINKVYNGQQWKEQSDDKYEAWMETWIGNLLDKLSPTGSVYLCGDWKNTAVLQRVLSRHLTILNRITWQREKGRGASKNWKNGMEDIWFAVADPHHYYFDIEAVKVRRRVKAPYRTDGMPRDWQETEDGKFRDTCPSNFWDDITVPFWSMTENTEHPTQKPEKLLAKLLLASCPKDGIVLDPFVGSGTTPVTAKKLGFHWVGVEREMHYCLLAEKRLQLADDNKTIQGFKDGVFWERNSINK